MTALWSYIHTDCRPSSCLVSHHRAPPHTPIQTVCMECCNNICAILFKWEKSKTKKIENKPPRENYAAILFGLQ